MFSVPTLLSRIVERAFKFSKIAKFGHEILKYGRYPPAKLANFVYICITRKTVLPLPANFGKCGQVFSGVIQIYTKLYNTQYYNTKYIQKSGAVARTLIGENGGGGGIFKYSCSARRVFFQIKYFETKPNSFTNFKIKILLILRSRFTLKGEWPILPKRT